MDLQRIGSVSKLSFNGYLCEVYRTGILRVNLPWLVRRVLIPKYVTVPVLTVILMSTAE
jgi:hypothetical protein